LLRHFKNPLLYHGIAGLLLPEQSDEAVRQAGTIIFMLGMSDSMSFILQITVRRQEFGGDTANSFIRKVKTAESDQASARSVFGYRTDKSMQLILTNMDDVLCHKVVGGAAWKTKN
jgi:hypothetical protein